MAVKVPFTNNRFKVRQQMQGNVKRALTALGKEAGFFVTN